MGIRDALAAEGNAPLVFMGGTCAGPKWRERLCGQVSKSFRWFNPVVDEWSEQAKETELTVRAEADVMLYAITPYQEGCYSYLEMTEDAVRSEKPVVIAFLPSFEDKAFSEQQWSSIISAKRLLERNNATVVLSMEELIDWFNRYNDKAPDGKMLDTNELLRRAQAQEDQPGEPKPAPVTAAGLVNAVQQERAQALTKPAEAEPGTSKAVGDAGTANAGPTPATESLVDDLSISTEGFFDGVLAKLKGYTNPSPGDEKDGKKVSSMSWAKQQRQEIEKTFANPGWVKHNFHAASTTPAENTLRRLTVGGKILKPAAGIVEGNAMLEAFIRAELPRVSRYCDGLDALEAAAQKQYDNKVDPATIIAGLTKGANALPEPVKVGTKSPILPGGVFVEYINRNQSVFCKEVDIPADKNWALPELTEQDIVDAGKALLNFGAYYDKLLSLIPTAGSGCDDGFWEDDQFDYEKPGMGEVYDLFYYQSIPDNATTGLYDAIWAYAEYCREVGRWLQSYTK